jgi:signal transduction histidine kinase
MRPRDVEAGIDADEIRSYVEDRPHQVFETDRKTKDGRHIPVAIRSTITTYRGQNAIRSIGRDITRRQERERRLEEFASFVSRDLRNPLEVASGNLELRRGARESEYVEPIARVHGRTDALIDDLLSRARE